MPSKLHTLFIIQIGRLKKTEMKILPSLFSAAFLETRLFHHNFLRKIIIAYTVRR